MGSILSLKDQSLQQTRGGSPATPAIATAPTACNADRLPANDLDDAIVTALINTYGDTDLVANAIARSVGRHAD